jgi:hypothetical protein
VIGRVVLLPRTAESKGGEMGGKINIVNEKNYFIRLRNFKLRSNLKENYINGCHFFNSS